MTAQNNDFILRMLERLDEKMDDLIKGHAEYKAAFEVHTKTDEVLDGIIKEETVTIRRVLTQQADNLNTYNQQLKEHMRRTELLEVRIDPLEKDLIARQAKQSFLTAHWKKISIVAAAISGCAAATWSIIQIVGYLTLK